MDQDIPPLTAASPSSGPHPVSSQPSLPAVEVSTPFVANPRITVDSSPNLPNSQKWPYLVLVGIAVLGGGWYVISHRPGSHFVPVTPVVAGTLTSLPGSAVQIQVPPGYSVTADGVYLTATKGVDGEKIIMDAGNSSDDMSQPSDPGVSAVKLTADTLRQALQFNNVSFSEYQVTLEGQPATVFDIGGIASGPGLAHDYYDIVQHRTDGDYLFSLRVYSGNLVKTAVADFSGFVGSVQ